MPTASGAGLRWGDGYGPTGGPTEVLQLCRGVGETSDVWGGECA